MLNELEFQGGYTKDPGFADEDDEDAPSSEPVAAVSAVPVATPPPPPPESRSAVKVSEFNLDSFDLGDSKRGVKLSSTFGPRTINVPGASTNHKALDFAAQKNTVVYAVLRGEVVGVGYTDGLGNFIKIKHETDPEIYTRYLHLAALPTHKNADTVEAGEEIGRVGNTGISGGPHLHFEVYNDRDLRIDPLPWLKDNPTATFPVAVTD